MVCHAVTGETNAKVLLTYSNQTFTSFSAGPNLSYPLNEIEDYEK